MTELGARVLKDKAHLVGLAGVFLLGFLAFAVARAFLVPRDFGLLGHFRSGALSDNRSQPLVYAGREACAACHEEQAQTLAGGKHAGVGCEACHGPLAAHADDPEVPPGHRPDPRSVCLGCHAANAAKPVTFPQVEVAEHSPDGACTECHRAHDPSGEGRATP